MQKFKALWLAFFIFLFTAPLSLAHVHWFVVEDNIEPISWYFISDQAVLVWATIVLLAVLLARYLNKFIKTPKSLELFNQKYETQIIRGAQVLLGIFFLVTIPFLWNEIITPTVSAGHPVRILIQGVQFVLGIMFLFKIYPRIAALVLLLLAIPFTWWSGIVALLENLLIFALAFYFLVVDAKEKSSLFKFKKNALPILRIGTGISLITLALTEKLLAPQLSLAFLNDHNWNFMQTMFSNFSDNLFVLSVGMSELLFGLVFTFGYLTRITTICLSVFLISSATAMYLSVGDWEPGHVVMYAIALIFVFFGSDFNPKKD